MCVAVSVVITYYGSSAHVTHDPSSVPTDLGIAVVGTICSSSSAVAFSCLPDFLWPFGNGAITVDGSCRNLGITFEEEETQSVQDSNWIQSRALILVP